MYDFVQSSRLRNWYSRGKQPMTTIYILLLRNSIYQRCVVIHRNRLFAVPQCTQSLFPSKNSFIQIVCRYFFFLDSTKRSQKCITMTIFIPIRLLSLFLVEGCQTQKIGPRLCLFHLKLFLRIRDYLFFEYYDQKTKTVQKICSE